MDLECPDGWKLVSLRELGEVNRGRSRHRPRYAEHLYGGPYPFIQTGDVKASNGKVTTHTQTYSEAGLAQSRLWPAGTMCITIAANIAETGILTFPACFPDSVVGFIAEPRKADVHFIEYMFRFLRSRIQHQATGSVQDNINVETLDRLHFPLPPLAEQKAIAGVLRALDDKIELNRRMNATLEAMARALFQSWFVDFDPVRAKLDGRPPAGLDAATAALFPATFQDSSLGHIPHGWRAATLGDVTEISDSKRIPLSGRERETRRGKYPYHGAASVMDSVDDFLFDGVYVLMGEDGSVINEDGTPVLQYVWGKFWVNNHAHVLRGKNGVSTEHLLLHLKECNIAPFVNGAVQPKLNQGNMNRIPFIHPTPEIGKVFAGTVEPLFARIRANTEQSRTLATLRDTLLPKLLSGELSVAVGNSPELPDGSSRRRQKP